MIVSLEGIIRVIAGKVNDVLDIVVLAGIVELSPSHCSAGVLFLVLWFTCSYRIVVVVRMTPVFLDGLASSSTADTFG